MKGAQEWQSNSEVISPRGWSGKRMNLMKKSVYQEKRNKENKTESMEVRHGSEGIP